MATRFSIFLEKFRRITSGSSGYMPEVDGLRFIAITWVAVVMHLSNIIDQKLYGGELIKSDFIAKFVLEGGQGVPFFFMISGFILALPFLKEKLYEGKKISIWKYYLRRLTRLEPPYIIALLIAFAGLVFVTGEHSAGELSDNLLASVFYVHNVIYQEHSRVLPVAWSLEIETRFYLLAPFLVYILSLNHPLLRRVMLVLIATAGCMQQYADLWNPASPFINFLCFFLMGILLADLYLAKWKLLSSRKLCKWVGIIVFIGMHFIFTTQSMILYLLKMYAMTLFFYIGVTNDWWKKTLRIQWVSIIGGMCYSIYLLHLMIMSVATNFLAEFPIDNEFVGYIIYAVVILFAVLAGSMVFYKFIEQPCMKRDWYKYIFRKRTT